MHPQCTQYMCGASPALGCVWCVLVTAQVQHFLTIIAPNQDSTFALAILWTCLQILCSSFFVQFSQV